MTANNLGRVFLKTHVNAQLNIRVIGTDRDYFRYILTLQSCNDTSQPHSSTLFEINTDGCKPYDIVEILVQLSQPNLNLTI
jgi:hypothetical protein